jgi:hypothetical protein
MMRYRSRVLKISSNIAQKIALTDAVLFPNTSPP